MAAEDTTLDTILSSLHDLENVKAANEELLRKEVEKRKELEAKVQQAMEELRIATVQHSQLVQEEETARQSLTKMKEQVKYLENTNQEKNRLIEELNSQITAEEEKQQEDLDKFEKKMTELSNKFRTAPSFYTPENLDRNITELTKGIEELKTKDTEQETMETSEDGQLQIQDDEQLQIEDDIVSEEQKSMVIEMFQEECEASQRERERMEEEEKQLDEEIKRLEDELFRLNEINKEE